MPAPTINAEPPRDRMPTFGVEFEFILGAIRGPDAIDPDPTDPRQRYFGVEPIDFAQFPATWEGEGNANGDTIRRHLRNTLREVGLPVGAGIIGDINVWEVKSDNSLEVPRNDDYHWWQVEIVTPALWYTPEALNDLTTFCRTLRERYLVMVNDSCGLHVHVGFGKNGYELPHLRNITAFLTAFEPTLDQVHPRHRVPHNYSPPFRTETVYAKEFRTEHGRFPRNLEAMSYWLAFTDLQELINQAEGSLDAGRLSYSVARIADALYMDDLRHKARATIEFRQHAGSLDPEAVCNWVRTVVGIIMFLRDTNQSTLINLLSLVTRERWQTPTQNTRELTDGNLSLVDLLRRMKMLVPAAYYETRGLNHHVYRTETTPENSDASDSSGNGGGDDRPRGRGNEPWRFIPPQSQQGSPERSESQHSSRRGDDDNDSSDDDDDNDNFRFVPPASQQESPASSRLESSASNKPFSPPPGVYTRAPRQRAEREQAPPPDQGRQHRPVAINLDSPEDPFKDFSGIHRHPSESDLEIPFLEIPAPVILVPSRRESRGNSDSDGLEERLNAALAQQGQPLGLGSQQNSSSNTESDDILFMRPRAQAARQAQPLRRVSQASDGSDDFVMRPGATVVQPPPTHSSPTQSSSSEEFPMRDQKKHAFDESRSRSDSPPKSSSTDSNQAPTPTFRQPFSVPERLPVLRIANISPVAPGPRERQLREQRLRQRRQRRAAREPRLQSRGRQLRRRDQRAAEEQNRGRQFIGRGHLAAARGSDSESRGRHRGGDSESCGRPRGGDSESGRPRGGDSESRGRRRFRAFSRPRSQNSPPTTSSSSETKNTTDPYEDLTPTAASATFGREPSSAYSWATIDRSNADDIEALAPDSRDPRLPDNWRDFERQPDVEIDFWTGQRRRVNPPPIDRAPQHNSMNPNRPAYPGPEPIYLMMDTQYLVMQTFLTEALERDMGYVSPTPQELGDILPRQEQIREMLSGRGMNENDWENIDDDVLRLIQRQARYQLDEWRWGSRAQNLEEWEIREDRAWRQELLALERAASQRRAGGNVNPRDVRSTIAGARNPFAPQQMERAAPRPSMIEEDVSPGDPVPMVSQVGPDSDGERKGEWNEYFEGLENAGREKTEEERWAREMGLISSSTPSGEGVEGEEEWEDEEEKEGADIRDEARRRLMELEAEIMGGPLFGEKEADGEEEEGEWEEEEEEWEDAPEELEGEEEEEQEEAPKVSPKAPSLGKLNFEKGDDDYGF